MKKKVLTPDDIDSIIDDYIGQKIEDEKLAYAEAQCEAAFEGAGEDYGI